MNWFNNKALIKKAIDHDVSEVDVTPLLDVVFIMLIFFIVTASFVKESGIGIVTPPVDVSEVSMDNPPIVLRINFQDEFFVDERQLDVRAIKPTILRLKAERPDADVAIKVSPQAKTRTIVDAIDSVRAAKIMEPTLSLASR